MNHRTEQNLKEKHVLGDLKEESLSCSSNNKRHERGRREQQREHTEEFRCVCVCVCFYLWGVGDSKRDHVLAGVFNEEVMLIQQLHLPHPQPPQLIKELEESDDKTKSRVNWRDSPTYPRVYRGVRVPVLKSQVYQKKSTDQTWLHTLLYRSSMIGTIVINYLKTHLFMDVFYHHYTKRRKKSSIWNNKCILMKGWLNIL